MRAAGSAVELKIGSSLSNGSPGKYIWVTSRWTNAVPKTEKWMWAGRHALLWLRQGYAPGRMGDEPITSVVVRQRAARPEEVRVQRSIVRVSHVMVAAGCIRLPDLHQSPSEGPAAFVHHASCDNNPLPERLAVPNRASREIALRFRHRVVPEHRSRELGDRLIQQHQASRLRPEVRRLVGLVRLVRMGPPVTRIELPYQAHSATSSDAPMPSARFAAPKARLAAGMPAYTATCSRTSAISAWLAPVLRAALTCISSSS